MKAGELIKKLSKISDNDQRGGLLLKLMDYYEVTRLSDLSEEQILKFMKREGIDNEN